LGRKHISKEREYRVSTDDMTGSLLGFLLSPHGVVKESLNEYVLSELSGSTAH